MLRYYLRTLLELTILGLLGSAWWNGVQLFILCLEENLL